METGRAIFAEGSTQGQDKDVCQKLLRDGVENWRREDEATSEQSMGMDSRERWECEAERLNDRGSGCTDRTLDVRGADRPWTSWKRSLAREV
jgi:hypothetical protein